MRWFGQVLHALVVFALILGFLGYVCNVADQPEDSIANPETVISAGLEPLPHHPELRDPHRILVPISTMAPQRQREVDHELALAHVGPLSQR